ncbi:hypothetical protein BJX64DRAFT_181462 [Aspergillus heterothallicus]
MQLVSCLRTQSRVMHWPPPSPRSFGTIAYPSPIPLTVACPLERVPQFIIGMLYNPAMRISVAASISVAVV